MLCSWYYIDRFRLRVVLPFWYVFPSCYVMRKKGEREHVLCEGRKGGGKLFTTHFYRGYWLFYVILSQNFSVTVYMVFESKKHLINLLFSIKTWHVTFHDKILQKIYELKNIFERTTEIQIALIKLNSKYYTLWRFALCVVRFT